MTGACLNCGQELDEGVRCHAESFGNIIDREGRHFGGCWGGRFPTDEMDAEWRERHLNEKPSEPPPPVTEKQLDLWGK